MNNQEMKLIKHMGATCGGVTGCCGPMGCCGGCGRAMSCKGCGSCGGCGSCDEKTNKNQETEFAEKRF